ncbi:DUF6941 family protein [Nocardia sp. R6R-6]|uniref:DUF6941 family protein n=1 Tax=Nocardia sp. R6R-6 TaxID=3459303 RepID=UPI00403E092F
MIVTGAFFAEHVRVAEGKLDVLGGVFDGLVAPLRQPVMINLVMLLQCGPDDEGQPTPVNVVVTDEAGRIREVATPTGEIASGLNFELPADFSNGENSFYWLPIPVVFVGGGRHSFVVEVGESGTVVPLTIRATA